MERLHPIMFAGTGSDVGKSVIATAFCRIFRQDGHSPAPFKAQNMALNSAVTPDGLEMGRAQAVQAEAAGLEPHADMNPILLKPQSDRTCQVVVNGRARGNRDAYSYFRKEGREELGLQARLAFDRLSRLHNPIVMEGAGSISEINLRDTDIVNMPMAMHAGADVILVADIDRGGVFASVLGTVMLQRPEERALLKGIIINKFRGDIRLFEGGARMMENLTGLPVLGIVPYLDGMGIEGEDSVQLASKARTRQDPGKVGVAVVRLPHISNFTDFDALEQDPRACLWYADGPGAIEGADVVIIPGSKATIGDMEQMRRTGMAQAVLRARENGKTILGICGGYQMMGLDIADPNHAEGSTERADGLGLLPVHTVIDGEKVTRRARFSLSGGKGRFLQGYEIHAGRTVLDGGAEPRPLCMGEDGTPDGHVADERCMGTYMHGILDNAEFRDLLLQPYSKAASGGEPMDRGTFRQAQYDRLADHVRRHVDIGRIYRILGGGDAAATMRAGT